jgi:DNA gyrase subunit A
MNIANLLPISADERITSMIKVPEFDENKTLVMVTKQGVIKRIKLNAYNTSRKGGLIALELNEGDELAWVRMTEGQSQIIVATRKGMAVRFDEKTIREMGRQARGVRAIRLKDGDEVVGMSAVGDDDLLLTVSETGYGRISKVTDYRKTARGTKGVINYHTEKYGEVAAVCVVTPEQEDIIMISADGVVIRIAAASVRLCSRPAKGVTVMRIGQGNKIVAVAAVPHDEDESLDEIEAVEGEEAEADADADVVADIADEEE